MNSGTQLAETVRQILEEEANVLAKESGFIQRERVLSGADFAQTLIFGWLGEPEITLDGLTQVAGRREVEITASGLCQRFTPQAADFLQRLLERLTQVRLQAEAAPMALLKRFKAVIVEDSSRISLPDELAEVWQGCGGSQGSSQATLKLFVRWNVLSGDLQGPLLTDGRQADAKSPFKEQEVPAGGLYLGDQGFFEQGRLRQWHQRKEGQRRYSIMRLPVGTGLYTRKGHRLLLTGILPQQEGATVELGVLVGQKARVPARLILQRVRRGGRRTATPAPACRGARSWARAKRGDPLSGSWIIVVTNVPRRMLSLAETLVVLTVRGPLELLFRLWKEDGQIDEWRSTKRWRILCELYAKLAAMLIQHWLIEVGCWHDPQRSLVKAAQVVRREAGQLMVARRSGRVERVVRQIMGCMRSGCRIEKRKQFPSTVQRLEGAPMLGGKRTPRPKRSRHRDQCRRWPAGKGWASSKQRGKTNSRGSSLT